MSAPELQKGDRIRIAGISGEFVITGFREEKSGELIIRAYGGTKGKGSSRFVSAERARPLRARGGKQ